MAEVFAARRDRLRERYAENGGAVLISRPANVRYLAGTAPPGAVLLIGPAAGDGDTLCCPATPLSGATVTGRPDDGLRPALLPEDGPDPVIAAAGLAHRAKAGELAVEEHHLTVARYRAIGSELPRLRLADVGLAVERQRIVKDEEEIACLRIAAEITDQALGELLESILVGRTERHLALELERRLVDHGADGPAFPTSVATGPNSGRRGHRPTDRRVEEGDFLTVCVGADYRGYRCEIGRTFVIGTTPADWQIELYDLVFAAQRAARESLRPGMAYRDVDLAARRILDGAGHGAGLAPLTGHGVGLEIDEDPQLTPAAMGKLDACVPVTVEPGVHLPGRGGVRIDDTLVVRQEADGGPELLTITTKELLAL
ncbi:MULTISPECIES: aminopeptidase P family protein [Streptomyces]|uniref:Peptidase M24 family protein n=1 Tax=Streptomyces tsukubensis (strain DSM 42081 / NBRC 108919 / NRRL 18488 / 9993) TaxID=1114943 RepID=A0A7G3UMP7_STRT9|nr:MULTISPECIES: aminopeptidase P family protein [Streptomyces]AZK93160.1 peptidase M24 family protein [Streptomyces tsukubensis]MYS63087.1 M24 family metallopeptidase [Streptomyces sp. SID5473]QKM70675.1 peptidase M24 family protein [Streptomyces tsukubensis NRRL18488]TAI41231.1 M24 family metallopeptidase [Streptomyces tsukubensis]